jgi:hypothetical protein
MTLDKARPNALIHKYFRSLISDANCHPIYENGLMAKRFLIWINAPEFWILDIQ